MTPDLFRLQKKTSQESSQGLEVKEVLNKGKDGITPSTIVRG